MPIALVTGAGVRVGRAIAETLAAAGYDVLLHGLHSLSGLAEAQRRITARGRRAEVLVADLATADGPASLAARARALTDALDLLVNSAAIYERAPFAEVSREAYRRTMAINLDAPFFLTQALVPLLRAAPGASVVNVTDVATGKPYAEYAHYMVTKAGLDMLTRALALELAPEVRVNAVAPGAVAFPPDFDAAKQARLLARVPLGRAGSPDDVARAVLFLARDAPYMTGQVVSVDGGFSIA